MDCGGGGGGGMMCAGFLFCSVDGERSQRHGVWVPEPRHAAVPAGELFDEV